MLAQDHLKSNSSVALLMNLRALPFLNRLTKLKKKRESLVKVNLYKQLC
jgi:hypothetical protein